LRKTDEVMAFPQRLIKFGTNVVDWFLKGGDAYGSFSLLSIENQEN